MPFLPELNSEFSVRHVINPYFTITLNCIFNFSIYYYILYYFALTILLQYVLFTLDKPKRRMSNE
nr:MAG TPA: hypothetical protein [Caudoviricetes sp.]